MGATKSWLSLTPGPPHFGAHTQLPSAPSTRLFPITVGKIVRVGGGGGGHLFLLEAWPTSVRFFLIFILFGCRLVHRLQKGCTSTFLAKNGAVV